MKKIFTKQRIAAGTVAIALAAGVHAPVRAENQDLFHVPENLSIAMADEDSEISTFEASPGVVGEVELIRERYPDGKIHIERQVALDGEGNYVNHGAWKMYAPNGEIIAEGQYNFGERIGLWTRWHGKNDVDSFKEFPFNNFKAPFKSQAHFTDGRMDGDWIISDVDDRKIMTVALKAGLRSGPTTLYLPNGKIMRQAAYDHSIPVGDVLEANKTTGELERVATYIDGRKIITDIDYFPNTRQKQKKSETMYLAAKTVGDTRDDFWNVRLAKFKSEGKDLRHGTAKSWYANGKPRMEGFYQNGEKAGTFTYWHENGQVAATGDYRNGLAQGTWIWWHENGQKSAIGKYESGVLMGEWRWWGADGKLTKQQTYDGSENVTSTEESTPDLSNKPMQTKTVRQ